MEVLSRAEEQAWVQTLFRNFGSCEITWLFKEEAPTVELQTGYASLKFKYSYNRSVSVLTAL